MERKYREKTQENYFLSLRRRKTLLPLRDLLKLQPILVEYPDLLVQIRLRDIYIAVLEQGYPGRQMIREVLCFTGRHFDERLLLISRLLLHQLQERDSYIRELEQFLKIEAAENKQRGPHSSF